MKFREDLSNIVVIKKSNDEKLFNNTTLETLSKLDQTREDFWNVDNESANFLNL